MPEQTRGSGGGPGNPVIEPLTRRERDVLALLARGYSVPEKAAHLSIAANSVRAVQT